MGKRRLRADLLAGVVQPEIAEAYGLEMGGVVFSYSDWQAAPALLCADWMLLTEALGEYERRELERARRR